LKKVRQVVYPNSRNLFWAAGGKLRIFR